MHVAANEAIVSVILSSIDFLLLFPNFKGSLEGEEINVAIDPESAFLAGGSVLETL